MPVAAGPLFTRRGAGSQQPTVHRWAVPTGCPERFRLMAEPHRSRRRTLLVAALASLLVIALASVAHATTPAPAPLAAGWLARQMVDGASPTQASTSMRRRAPGTGDHIAASAAVGAA